MRRLAFIGAAEAEKQHSTAIIHSSRIRSDDAASWFVIAHRRWIMRALTLASACVLAVAVSSASAGSIAFTNATATSVTAGTDIFVDVELGLNTGVLTDFDFAGILIGSDDATDLNFTLDSAWTTAFESNALTFDDMFLYAQEVDLTSMSTDGPIGLTDIVVGNLEIDTTGMAPGFYGVFVDNDFDAFSEAVNISESSDPDPLFGSFSFEVVPGPAPLALFALAAPLLARRRRG
jgi:hypothetical protein